MRVAIAGAGNVGRSIANELIEMGMLDSKREDLVLVIRLRFPAILTPDVEQAIADQPSLPVMKAWHAAACNPATTAESFLGIVRQEPWRRS